MSKWIQCPGCGGDRSFVEFYAASPIAEQPSERYHKCPVCDGDGDIEIPEHGEYVEYALSYEDEPETKPMKGKVVVEEVFDTEDLDCPKIGAWVSVMVFVKAKEVV